MKPLERRALKAGLISEIKRALTDNHYSVSLAAMVLEMRPNRLSEKLNGRGELAEWWAAKKREKKKKNARERQRRSRDRRAERTAAEQGADPRFEQW